MTVRILVQSDPELDEETWARLVRRLRAELDELDVDSVEAAPGGPAPAGAKVGDPITLGALIVTLSASGGVFPSLIAAVRDWLERQTGRHRVSVTIDGDSVDLERATTDQQRRLVEAFLRRHTVT